MSDFRNVDVLIVGAGLSGVGAAWHVQRNGWTYAVLEARNRLGGTWDLFRYPGVRSDSDMFTLGYPFQPWRGAKSLADGDSIRRYIEDTAREHGIDRHVRHGVRVVSAAWSWKGSRWVVETQEGGRSRVWTCSFLYVCAGYYDYARGHQPDFEGVERFGGRFVHPQFWPEDLDVAGKRVVVIGSGATAVTLVPALAETAAHVTMVQRSPAYLVSRPGTDRTADVLRRLLPARFAHALIRGRNVLGGQLTYWLSRRFPERTKRYLRGGLLRLLPDPAYLDRHFTPRYQPWDQRLCVVPDGDFFRPLSAGRASVVTDGIARFTAGGIELESGESLDADVVVSATGLSLLPLGGIRLSVDGRAVDLARTTAYRGLMLSGVPNLAFCVGYVNASWTLRADLSSRYVVRLLDHMRRRGLTTAMPGLPPRQSGRPLLSLTSTYVQRAAHLFPRQGERDPWTVTQNHLLDRARFAFLDLRKGMVFDD
ncbi:flavin-containing monooxygenase [Planomonospora venezuelensis]|uniref:Cation diffusion facilitator CzcD-associated flavoprotein CzcO n=1 Tax=Planomonospora venezuelensis TaxID=1999 RepID=A0A841DEY2_PLAVE|nr:NAD(P)/FAD-dependent oxidoreductase [Planomonospora venezuelensis]MBB5966964.1 cation diffusion facilitator CzcD-associated flavoprotein CzcO [Planomonospora venezuelensis]GIN01567.1 monooxygenase flavin-binding family protein [Planomonospora venezuelensis]